MLNHTTILLYISLLLAVSGCKHGSSNNKASEAESGRKPLLFTLLPSGHTGINFSNTLIEGVNTNILMYEYFYNGGGVATGDLNADGLTDIYFSSNMGKNKVYLNKGNMQFEDITVLSGAMGREGPWKTGITMADVNGDNKLDLYLCYSGMVRDANRVNQLFINEGNDKNNVPRFSEKAAEYGLASIAYSNQAYFFDYDRDGDLDALLLNHNPNALPILNEVRTAELLKKDDPLRGIRLFKQTDGHFTDVTVRSGINGSPLTYGLGAGIADLNNDQWPDIYISNDYAVPDYLYINNKNGTFTDQLQKSIGHTSQFSMGNDIADVNNDGLPEIFTLDMLPEDNHRQKLLLAPDNYAKFDLNIRSGFYYQYMRNMLQLNNGNGTYSEIGQLSGISNTDWSWAALFADYDNDGWKDLFVTNGYYRDFTNLDFVKYMDDFVKSKRSLKREDVLNLINYMPASNIVNYMFANKNGLTFSNETEAWGMKYTSNSNGAAYADLDNDGDLDLAVNNLGKPAFIFRNEADKIRDHHYLQVKLQGEGSNTQGTGADVTLWSGAHSQVLEQMPTRGYLSTVSNILHFGLGKENHIDSIRVRWPRGKQQTLSDVKTDQLLTLSEKDAAFSDSPVPVAVPVFKSVSSPIQYQHPSIEINDFKRQPLLTNQLSYSGPCLVKGDVNGDGLDDVYVGGGEGQSARLYLQTGSNKFVLKPIAAFEADRFSKDADAVFFDANADGHTDIYVASGGYHHFDKDDSLLQDRLYFNDGTENFSKRENALPEMRVSKGCVTVNDINGDGFQDVFVSGRVVPGRYPEPPLSFLLVNDGKGNFTNQINTIAAELEHLGMITDAVWTDLNEDRKNDLVLVGEWLPVSVFINVNGKLQNETNQYFKRKYNGWWNALAISDLNNDGTPDLLVGNLGTNTQCKASAREPADLYFSDFDNNGSVDPFLCFYIQGKSFPYVTRDELLDQVGGFRSRYTTYKRYADAGLEDLFTKEQLSAAGHWQANHQETTLFLSNADGKYEPSPLPVQAQYSPVYTITVLDYDDDGKKDVLLCGNNSRAKLRLGKSDANYGILLQGNGNGNFQYVDQKKSGFDLRGDVRSVIALNNTLLFGVNGQFILAYKRTRTKSLARLTGFSKH